MPSAGARASATAVPRSSSGSTWRSSTRLEADGVGCAPLLRRTLERSRRASRRTAAAPAFLGGRREAGRGEDVSEPAELVFVGGTGRSGTTVLGSAPGPPLPLLRRADRVPLPLQPEGARRRRGRPGRRPMSSCASFGPTGGTGSGSARARWSRRASSAAPGSPSTAPARACGSATDEARVRGLHQIVDRERVRARPSRGSRTAATPT